MLSEPTYIPARMVAANIETHFSVHLDNARENGVSIFAATMRAGM